MSIANTYLRMLQEAKKKEEEKLDPVGKADADIDNDGDVDSSDEYLHKRRKAIKKSMKNEETCSECEGKGCDHCDGKGHHEAVEIDPENGEVTKMKKDKKSKKGEVEKTDMQEQSKGTAQYGVKADEQEKLEPRAKGEKEFADKHKVDVVDRPDATKQDGAEKVKKAPARPGDNAQGDKLKTFKDIRK